MNRLLCMITFCAMMIGMAHADFLDEFDSPVLDPGWRIANEDSLHWSLVDRPGFLRIQSQFYYSQPVNFFYHTEVITGGFEVSTMIMAQPDSAGQVAVISADYDSFFTSPQAIIGFGNVQNLGRVVFTVFDDTILGGALYADSLVYLRLRTSNDTVFGEFSINNTDWTDIGSFCDPHFHELQAVGLTAVNMLELGGTPQTPEMNADFDWFHLVALTGVEESTSNSPGRASDLLAKPNPFRKKTTIHYALSSKQQNGIPSLRVFDASGRLIKSFDLPSAYSLVPSEIIWSGDDQNGLQVPAGVYFVRRVDIGAATIRIVKIK